MTTRRDNTSNARHSGKRKAGFAIVSLVALFDIASAMAPASAALHTEPPRGLRNCFRTYFGDGELKKLVTAAPLIDGAFSRSEDGKAVY
jgi:hypothetical protein